MRLPEIRIKKQELRSKNYFSYLFLTVIFLISLFVYPRKVLADFAGGINIGDKYSEFATAAQASNGSGWVYVMMKPTDADKLIQWQNQFPNIKIIVRGHYPDYGGNSLTADYAREWSAKLKNLPRPVYFIPVNEPNNPSESVTGISAAKVKEYTDNLINELNSNNLLTGTSKRVILLSPSIDIFTLSDQGGQYITDLGGWSFFQKFEGICLNLYGQFDGTQLDPNAPPIKRGQGYREFLKSHFGADETQSQNAKIYACETGVIKIADAKVKYKENAAEIVTYFNLMKSVWGSDPNFMMYAIFSYDPTNYSLPSWIYSEKQVLQTMGLTGGSTVITPVVNPNTFANEFDIAENANKNLLPYQILQEKNKPCALAWQIKIGNKCIDLNGIVAFFTGRTNKNDPTKPENLATETEYMQHYSVSENKKVVIESGGEITKKVPEQVIKEETGAFNMFRPNSLDFTEVAYSGRDLASGDKDKDVLGVAKTPEGEVKSGFYNTLKMLLPFSMGSELTKPVEVTPPPQYPTVTPTIPPTGPTPTVPIPTITPPPAAFALNDPYGSPLFKNLISDVGQHFGVPPSIIAAVSWIEGNNVWRYNDSEIASFSQENIKDPFWVATGGNTGECRMNGCSAAGPLQFTTGLEAALNYGYSSWYICGAGCKGLDQIDVDRYFRCAEEKDPKEYWLPNQWDGYKYAVWEALGESSRNPIVCNIKDSFWAAGKKLKNDSQTSGSSVSWDKTAVANSGYAYYGACGSCDETGDPQLSKGARNEFACQRLGMSYCEYMWKYYQCNEQSTNSSEFAECILREGLQRIRF